MADDLIPTLKPSTVGGEAVLKAALKDYGLDSMAGDLLAYLRGEGAGSVEATYLKMRENPLYKQRFAGMEAREKAGYDPISEEAYVQWEGQAKALFDHYDIPKDFYDTKEELDAFIAGDVSPDELKRRIVDGYQAVYSSPPETLSALQSMYNIDSGHMAAFFLDPTKGEEIIKQRWTAAQIGGFAQKTGFGALSAAEAERLGTGGLTGQKAQEAFGVLAQQDQLTQDLTREEKLAAVGGDVAAGEKIATEAKKKKAAFDAGGTYATGTGGVSGLGTAGG